MKLIKHLPLFTFLLLTYNILAFFGGSETPLFEKSLFSWTLASGASIEFTVDLVMVLAGLLVFFIELMKSTKTSTAAIIDHGLSTLVFIGFLLEFILIPEAGTWGFLMLTVLALMDVIAGFTVSISTARRDLAIEK